MSKSEKINKDINDIQKNEIIDNELTFINYVSNTDENTFGFYNKIINSLEKNPMFLKHLPTNSKYYYNYISHVLKKNGLALQFLPKNIDNYDKFCLQAINNNIKALQFADNLKNDLLFIIDKYEKEPEILKYAADHIKSDGYFKDKLYQNDFLNCDNKNANFFNKLGTCWMVSIFTIFLFADLTRNNIQNELMQTENNISLLTKSKDLLKYLIPFAFNDENEINNDFKYLLIKFINTLKKEFILKIDQNKKKQEDDKEGLNRDQSSNSNMFSSNIEQCKFINEDILFQTFKNIFLDEIKFSESKIEYGAASNKLNIDLDYEYSLSNLISILFLNKIVNIYKFKDQDLSIEYSLKNIHLLDTVGHILQTEDHEVGFFKCNNKLKLVNNNYVIDFNYYDFINLIIELRKTKNLINKFEIYHCSDNTKNVFTYIGFIIILENKKLIYYFNKESLEEYNYIEIEKKRDFIILDKKYYIFKKLENISMITIKLNSNFKIKILRNEENFDNIKKNNIKILLCNSILFNDYDLFNNIYINNEQYIKNEISRTQFFIFNLSKAYSSKINFDINFKKHPLIILLNFYNDLKNNNFENFKININEYRKLFDKKILPLRNFTYIINKTKNKFDEKKFNTENLIKKILKKEKEVEKRQKNLLETKKDYDGGYHKYIYKIKYN